MKTRFLFFIFAFAGMANAGAQEALLSLENFSHDFNTGKYSFDIRGTEVSGPIPVGSSFFDVNVTSGAFLSSTMCLSNNSTFSSNGYSMSANFIAADVIRIDLAYTGPANTAETLDRNPGEIITTVTLDVLDITKASGISWDTASISMTSGGSPLLTMSGSDNIGLPVRLISFNARTSSAGVSLAWTTASEENNKGFHVERGLDGKTWVGIHFEPAKTEGGHSGQPLYYNYDDRTVQRGVLYYRLRQQDLNGTEEIVGGIQRVIINDMPALPASFWPNPATSFVFIRNEACTAAEVWTLDGRMVCNKRLTGETKLDISAIRQGFYRLTLRNAAGEVICVEKISIID